MNKIAELRTVEGQLRRAMQCSFDSEKHAAWVAAGRAYKRELYLAAKARKDADIKSLDLHVGDIPTDVLAAIELDCRRYRQARITAALRKVAEARLKT